MFQASRTINFAAAVLNLGVWCLWLPHAVF